MKVQTTNTFPSLPILIGFYLCFCGTALPAQNYAWAKRMGGTSNDSGNGIAVDGSGNVYTTGSFAGTVDFDPGAGTASLISAGSSDIFVSKLDASGNYVWVKRMGGTLDDHSVSIAVDGSGNVYTTGFFGGTVDFDPSAGTDSLISAGSVDIFVSKLDASGNFVWAKSMGGTLEDLAWGIAVDGPGNVYTTGSFQLTVDFDPGAGTANLVSAGNIDIFVSKLDASGNFVWAKSMGGTGFEEGSAITVDGSGNVYTIGDFVGTVDFDPNAGTASLISAGGDDIFVSKLSARGVAVQSIRESKVRIYPSLTAGYLTIEGAKSFDVVNVMGQVLLSQTAFQGSSINIHAYPNGFYLIKGVDTEGGIFSKKIIKQ